MQPNQNVNNDDNGGFSYSSSSSSITSSSSNSSNESDREDKSNDDRKKDAPVCFFHFTEIGGSRAKAQRKLKQHHEGAGTLQRNNVRYH